MSPLHTFFFYMRAPLRSNVRGGESLSHLYVSSSSHIIPAAGLLHSCSWLYGSIHGIGDTSNQGHCPRTNAYFSRQRNSFCMKTKFTDQIVSELKIDVQIMKKKVRWQLFFLFLWSLPYYESLETETRQVSRQGQHQIFK